MHICSSYKNVSGSLSGIFDSLMENFSIMGSVNSLAFSGHAFTHAQHLMHLSPSQSNFSSIAPTGHASMHFPHPMHLSVATDCIKGILGAGLFGISPGKASAFKPSFHSSPPAILPMTFFPKALANAISSSLGLPMAMGHLLFAYECSPMNPAPATAISPDFSEMSASAIRASPNLLFP